MKQPHLSICMILLVIIGILNILIATLVGKDVYASWIHFEQAQTLKRGSAIINLLYDVNKNLSLERGASFSILYVPHETAEFLQKDILASRRSADTTVERAFKALPSTSDADLSIAIQSAREKYKGLQNLRRQLDALTKMPQATDAKIPDEIFDASTDLIAELQNLILLYGRSIGVNDASISRQMMFKYFVWQLAEYAGQEYALIGRMIAKNKRPDFTQQEQLMLLRGRIQYGWEILHKYAVRDAVARKVLRYTEEAETQYFMTFEQIKDFFYGPQPAAQNANYPISIEMWLGIAAQAVDSLLILQSEAVKITQYNVELIEKNSKNEMLINIMVFLCALGLSLYCWSIIIFRVTGPVNAMVDALYKATKQEIFEMPKIAYRHDEIGKLANVLEVFQDNAKKMKQSNEELERFAYIAAHDLKSPLRAVDNISQWLEEDLKDSLQEKDRKYMSELRSRVRLMDKLLDDTLEYARIGTKIETKAGEIVKGKAMVEEIVALLALPEGFTLKISERLSRIEIEKLPLQQVLFNLINNALKHHDKPSGIIEVGVEERRADYVFTIRDNGPGIAPQYHQKIFEMFQTLQADKSKGRGMGLAMVKKIVATQGGEITVESEPGKGALFRFTWPKSEIAKKGEDNADDRRRYA